MENLEEQVNNIALLVLMLPDDDVAGAEIVIDLLKDLKSACEEVGEHARLVAACEHAIEQNGEDDYVPLLKDFASAAQAYLAGAGSACFPNEGGGESEEAVLPDISPDADQTFLVDFVEKYSSGLDELESAVLDFRFQTKDAEKFNADVKRFIHTMKGDAGCVGLQGIERASHEVEDYLVGHGTEKCADQILAFKEWVGQFVAAITAGESPGENSAAFIKRVLSVAPEAADLGELEQEGPTESSSDSSTAESVSVSEAIPADVEQVAEKEEEPPLEPYAINADDEILGEFIVEAEDQLNTVEEILLSGKEVYESDDLNAIFRAVHSIKGGSSYFNLQEITQTSHLTETLMDHARNGEIHFSVGLSKVILDYIALQRDRFDESRKAVSSGSLVEPTDRAPRYCAVVEDYLESIQMVKNIAESLEKGDFSDLAEEDMNVSSASESGSVNEKSAESSQEKQETSVKAPIAEEKEQVKAPKAAPAPAKAAKDSKSDTADKKKGDALAVKTFVKVDTDRLDQLVDAIGEMIIYSSMLIATCRRLLPDNEFVSKTSHQVEKFARDLQDLGMSMRLVPIKGLFQRMSRLVWDTSRKINKEVSFEVEGEDTELDRNLIDRLTDPLMHMVRNSVDHGIETPEEREKLGKPRAGTVRLSAAHGGGSIFIRIKDDGKGIDPSVILAKAIEKGVVSEDQILSEQEIYQLIFAPGFSTAAEVTDISGRGVGMDVVRKNIEAMRGNIHIESTLGEGTTFSIEIPLTLAIIDGIETMVGDQRYIIPTLSIVEFIQPTADMISTTTHKVETFHFRGAHLPIYRLYRLYDVEPVYTNPTEAIFVVVECNGEHFALMVDKIVGQYSTVIKSLGSLFEGDRGTAGCAIMADGRAGLILDMRSLLKLAREDYSIEPESLLSHDVTLTDKGPTESDLLM